MTADELAQLQASAEPDLPAYAGQPDLSAQQIDPAAMSAAPPQPAAQPSMPDAASVALPDRIETQEQFDALPQWQKDLIRLQAQGVKVTQSKAAEYAMSSIAKEREAKSSQKQLAIKPSDLMGLAEYGNLTKLADKAASEIEALPDGALGPIDTRWNELKGTWVGADPKFQTAMQAYNSVKNQILKMRSGAAVTENEMQRMLQELGDPRSADATFKRSVRGFSSGLKNLMADKVQALQESGYEVPKTLASSFGPAQPGGQPGGQPGETAAATGAAPAAPQRQVVRGHTYEKQGDGKWHLVQ